MMLRSSVPLAFHRPSISSSNYSGAPSNKQQRLWVLFNLFCQEVLFQSRSDHDSHSGRAHFSLPLISTNSQCQTRFSSVADRLVGWGLQDTNMTSVRHEMRTLLFKYINEGDAVVEFQE